MAKPNFPEDRQDSLHKMKKKKAFSVVEREAHSQVLQMKNVLFKHETQVDNVLDGTDFSLHKGEKVALVGPNGSGKSTLLKLLAKLEGYEPQHGQVHQGGSAIAYLPQEIEPEDGEGDLSVKDWLFEKIGFKKLAQDLETARKAMANGGDMSAVEAWGDLNEKFTKLGGWEFERNLEKAMQSIPRVDFSPDRKVGSLSGGETQRLKLLVIALSEHFDFIFLDETANDLDQEGVEWLGEFIKHVKAGVVTISHLRGFLAREDVFTSVAAIDPLKKKVLKANATYAELMAQIESELAGLETRAGSLSDEASRLKKELAHARAQVGSKGKASSDGDKLAANYRAGRADERKGKAVKKKVRALEGVLAEIALLEIPKKYDIRVDVEIEPIKSPTAIRFDGIQFRFPEKTIGPFSGQINSGDRIVIEGRNGVGKSLLLEALCSGTSRGGVKRANDARIFYMPQKRMLQETKTVQELVARYSTSPEGETRSRLRQFGLTEDLWERPMKSLSPGQRTRMLACLINLYKPNMIVLDEPTNHMDGEMTVALEKGLREYKGTLVVVTHDPVFRQNLNPTRVWRLDESGVHEK